jgi:uncharacterized protein YndB with AHSA1/START domain
MTAAAAATTTVSLPPEDVVELAEMLEFIAEWFTDQHDDLTTPLRRHTFGLFSIDELASDLHRFADRLGRTP